MQLWSSGTDYSKAMTLKTGECILSNYYDCVMFQGIHRPLSQTKTNHNHNINLNPKPIITEYAYENNIITMKKSAPNVRQLMTALQLLTANLPSCKLLQHERLHWII